jgi:aminoglycoside phosphotransferase (APT) family kinase protein
MKNDSEKELARAKDLARQVMMHHFGQKPERIRHMASGLSNFVFKVRHPEGTFVVRLSFDPSRLNSFIKEQWAQNRAVEAGVPATEILEVGNDIIGCPFMISRAVEGEEATHHPNRLEILREMGRYGALINSIPTSGFGGTFDWSSNQLSHNETLAEFFAKELRIDERLELLEKRRMLDAAQIKRLHKIFREAEEAKFKPHLNHGDLRLKNVMVDEAGQIKAFLDWEHAISSITPVWDLSIALHDLSIDEKQEFLGGYGLPEKKIREFAPLIKAINFINYVPEIERLFAAKETLLLEKYRTRLTGVLDFYCL